MAGHILKLSDNVTRKRVVYKDRYGRDIVGELYFAKDLDLEKKHAALIVGAPYGGVKEQGPCVYGNELAQKGFVVLTFDQAFMGESGGFPRNVSSPDIFVENFSAAVDYLGLQSFVDREKIGVIGICGSGGFALSAAQCDTRIKAVATMSMYDMTAAARLGMDKETVQKTKIRNMFPFSRKSLLIPYRKTWKSPQQSGSGFMRWSGDIIPMREGDLRQPALLP